MSNPNDAVLTPEQFVEKFNALVAQIGPVAPLTPEQRRMLKARTRVPQEVVEASINVIGSAESISQVVGIPAAEVRLIVDEASRWTAVESVLRTVLNGVAGANLVRRQRIALVTGQAYNIGRQLARDPGNAGLVPQVQEVKRLRKLSNRKKRGSQTPAPTPAPAPAPSQATEPSQA
jgi:hypothetical protein